MRLEQIGGMPPVNCPSPLPVLPLIPSLLGNLGLSASAGEGGEESDRQADQWVPEVGVGRGLCCHGEERSCSVGEEGAVEEDLEIEGKGESKQRGQEGK